MPPDSLAMACAGALFAACVGGWRLAASLKAAARLPLRFGAVLLAALACATALRMGDVAAMLLLPLAATALALAALARFARACGPFMASVAQMIALACGLYALVTGYAMPGLVLVMLAGLCVIAAALNRLAPAAILSGAALLAMGLCFLQAGAGAGVLLFSAASVIGLARPQSLRSTRRAMRGAAVP